MYQLSSFSRFRNRVNISISNTKIGSLRCALICDSNSFEFNVGLPVLLGKLQPHPTEN